MRIIQKSVQGIGSGTQAAASYKQRWQAELFFKALKQNLKIKTFVGTSANAVKTQVGTALIAMLLVKSLQWKARFQWSLSNLIALLRQHCSSIATRTSGWRIPSRPHPCWRECTTRGGNWSWSGKADLDSSHL